MYGIVWSFGTNFSKWDEAAEFAFLFCFAKDHLKECGAVFVAYRCYFFVWSSWADGAYRTKHLAVGTAVAIVTSVAKVAVTVCL